MRPISRTAVVTLVLPTLLALATGSVTAAPPPTFAIAMSVNMDSPDGVTCVQTAKATAKVKVDSISLSWYQESWLVATGTAPGTGPNDGTLKGRSATFPLTIRVSGPPPTNWHLEAQFYAGGVLQGTAVLDSWSLCAV